MRRLNLLVHKIHSASQRSAYQAFLAATGYVEQAQRRKLRDCLAASIGTETGRKLGLDADWTLETFQARVPISEYEDWEDAVLTQKRTGQPVLSRGCKRYEPTSGSTSRRKWIPYTPAFQRELSLAASAWLHDLSLREPGFTRGHHYWSLSWLPTELRSEVTTTSDSKIFPAFRQWILSQVMAVPGEVSLLETSELSRLANTAWLAATTDLTVLSVWSPTFAFEIFHDLSRHREEIARILRDGRWPAPGFASLRAPRSARASRLLSGWDGKVSSDFLKTFWPELKLVSAWDSSTSALWAEELRKLLPQARFQGKGLWATEGVVTIPFQERYPLAVTSHFFEFRCLDSGEVLPAWRLKQGQRLQPILTTGSGFFRYALQDSLEVTGHLHQAPCFRFLGRLGGVDLVGEKMDQASAADILKSLSDDFAIRAVTLLAVARGGSADPRPGYRLLAQGSARADRGSAENAGLEERLEARLREFHHYRLARELGQLQPAKAILREDALGYYQTLYGQRTGERVAGAAKLEAITYLEKEIE